ncbi:MAG: peptidoglycan-binding domain-containing protein, partial [Ilumatobacteraceae bacterium]
MRRRLIVLALAPAFAFTACSGDDEASEPTTTTIAPTVATVATAPPTTPPATAVPTAVVVTITARAVAPSTTVPAVTYDLTVPATCSMGAPAEFGSSGEDVRCLQERLQQVSSGGTPVAPDGQFGAAT